LVGVLAERSVATTSMPRVPVITWLATPIGGGVASLLDPIGRGVTTGFFFSSSSFFFFFAPKRLSET